MRLKSLKAPIYNIVGLSKVNINNTLKILIKYNVKGAKNCEKIV